MLVPSCGCVVARWREDRQRRERVLLWLLPLLEVPKGRRLFEQPTVSVGLSRVVPPFFPYFLRLAARSGMFISSPIKNGNAVMTTAMTCFSRVVCGWLMVSEWPVDI